MAKANQKARKMYYQQERIKAMAEQAQKSCDLSKMVTLEDQK